MGALMIKAGGDDPVEAGGGMGTMGGAANVPRDPDPKHGIGQQIGVSNGGPVLFRINDTDDGLRDNVGMMTVRIAVAHF